MTDQLPRVARLHLRKYSFLVPLQEANVCTDIIAMDAHFSIIANQLESWQYYLGVLYCIRVK